MMRAMVFPREESESLDVQVLVDSIPALIHTARPDGYLDYFNKPWLEYLGVTLHKVTGWNWTAFVHPEDVEGIVAKWRACLATGEVFEYETRVRSANGDHRWMFHRKVPLRDADGNIVKWYGSSFDIEERKTAEKKIREQETELRKLLNLIPHHVFVFGPDASPIFANQGAQEYFGVDADQLVAESRINFVHPDDREHFLAERKKGLFTGAAHEFEARLLRDDGTFRWFLFRRKPLKDERGHILRWYGTATDIEDRKRAEEELQRSEFYLAEGQRLAHAGSWAWNVRTGALFWSEEIFRIYGYSPQEIGPAWEQFLKRVHPEDRAQIEQRAKMEAGGEDWTESHGDFRVVLPDGTVKYLRSVAHPVRHSGEVTEVIGTVMDITEHELLTRELRRREAYLAEAQRLSHTGSFGWKPDTGEVVWSHETYRIFEYNLSVKLTIDSVVQRVHPQDQADFQKVVDGAAQGATDFEHAYRLLLPDGRVKHVHAVAHVLLDTSGNREFVGAVTDITERKRAEEDLRASESKYRQLVDTTPAFIHTALPDGSLDFLSRGWLEYGGLPQTDFLDWRWTAAIHPEDVKGFVDKWRAALVSGESFVAESRVRRADGEYRWFLQRNVPLRDETGKIVKWYGTGIDIEERKRAEEALRSSEAYLAEAQRLSHTGSWAWNLRTDVRHWSEECYRVLGFDPRDGAPPIEELIQRIHPDDQPAFRESVRMAKSRNLDEEVDYRIVHPGGVVRDIHSIGHPVFSSSGDLIEYTGTVIDVTERKRAEEELRRSEMELRQMLDLTPQVVAVYGPNSERIYANRVALDYLGLSLEEWRQASDRGVYFHTEDRKRVLDSFDRAFSSGSVEEMELRLRKSDGTYRWFFTRCVPLRDEKGQIKRFYSASIDIDDRKRAEQRLQHENVALREEVDKASMFEDIVGTSPALKGVLSHISKVAPSDSTVLITGETGTGKELVARAIHRRSNRASRPFVSVNCAAIPRDLIASELFGHEKGAFTGATQQRLGRFELANGGTIFLDEVGELPSETQIALLRVLQEHEFERVGGTRRIRADVRVIAATNRDLQAAISAGSFRSDLFYRLHVFPIAIPSLRERREDIPLLVEYFIDRYARKAGKNIKRVNKKTLELLQSYPWPGNIRELQNVIERSVILCETEIFSIDESWLPQQPLLTAEPKPQVELPRRLLVQEKDMIEAALKETRGRVSGPSGAAAKLGIPRSTLESKIRSLEIDKNRFKS
jgi:PAS domain S-box-containing protein